MMVRQLRDYEHRALALYYNGRYTEPMKTGHRSLPSQEIIETLAAAGYLECEDVRRGEIRLTDAGRAYIKEHGDGWSNR